MLTNMHGVSDSTGPVMGKTLFAPHKQNTSRAVAHNEQNCCNVESPTQTEKLQVSSRKRVRKQCFKLKWVWKRYIFKWYCVQTVLMADFNFLNVPEQRRC